LAIFLRTSSVILETRMVGRADGSNASIANRAGQKAAKKTFAPSNLKKGPGDGDRPDTK
jgi:hypothetical protein